MKLAAMAMTVAVASAWAEGHAIEVCMTGASEIQVISPARSMASELLDAVGIEVTWHTGRTCSRASNVLWVTLLDKTPPTAHTGALATALPYEGIHIAVFYDRVKAQSDYPSQALAYVLVHEITHILEGVARHSDEGIMKAHWTSVDFFAMRTKKLSFAAEDVRLLHLGMAQRASSLASHNDRVLVAAR